MLPFEELKNEEKFEYFLYRSIRLRVIKTGMRTIAEAEQANQFFKDSLCPNLQWRRDVNIKKYTIKKC